MLDSFIPASQKPTFILRSYGTAFFYLKKVKIEPRIIFFFRRSFIPERTRVFLELYTHDMYINLLLFSALKSEKISRKQQETMDSNY